MISKAPASGRARLSGRGRPGLRPGPVRGRLRAGRAGHGQGAAGPVRRRPVRPTTTWRSSSIRRTSPPRRRRQGLSRTVEGADETLMNFLETLVERHRMPEIFRIRSRYDELWDAERKLLPVEVTSAVELDEATIRSIGDRISQQTGNKIELTTVVDPDVLGGIVLRVGNFILDASHPKPVERPSQASRAGADTHACQGATQCQCRSSLTRSHQSSRVGSRGSTAPARISPRSGPCCRWRTASAASTAWRTACRWRCCEFPHDVTGLALNLESDNVGAVMFGEWEKVVEGDTVRRTKRLLEIPVGEELLGRIVDPLGTPLDGKGDIRTDADPSGRVQGARRRPASAGQGAHAHRLEGHRFDDPDRPRPAGADHRRPPDRQDRDCHRHHHQQQGPGSVLRLRGHRAAQVERRPAGLGARGGRRPQEHHHRDGGRRRGRPDQVPGSVCGLRHGRVLPLQRPGRADHLRRSHQARLRLPADVTPAPSPARPRGLSR